MKQTFMIRARKQEVTHLKKRVADIEKRRDDMKNAVEILRKQIADHEAEIEKLEAQ